MLTDDESPSGAAVVVSDFVVSDGMGVGVGVGAGVSMGAGVVPRGGISAEVVNAKILLSVAAFMLSMREK